MALKSGSKCVLPLFLLLHPMPAPGNFVIMYHVAAAADDDDDDTQL
jgi:hypothetical protein